MEVLEIVVSIIASSSYGSLWRIRGGKEGGSGYRRRGDWRYSEERNFCFGESTDTVLSAPSHAETTYA
jgi:hypothetical protein